MINQILTFQPKSSSITNFDHHVPFFVRELFKLWNFDYTELLFERKDIWSLEMLKKLKNYFRSWKRKKMKRNTAI